MAQVQNNNSAIGYAVPGIFVGIAALAIASIVAIANRLEATELDPAFCGPSPFHTTVEPPETQLTRDYAAIRVLLKDPSGPLEHVRHIYTGTFHIPAAIRAPSSLAKNSNRAQLFKADYQRNAWAGSLQIEAHRIDRERGTTFASDIDHGLQTGDRASIEATFRGVFAVLLDDLLKSIEQRLDQTATAGRTLQHVRRYYSEGLDAYLSINAVSIAIRANFALDAMTRAIDESITGKSSSREWFARERLNFMRAINEGLTIRASQQG
jgi:hypothetical protein